ncbi:MULTISPECIES: hypothetical protein [Rhizobium]|uniref:hypothetical protein n=1 Tax=Rhizobium TaxID=379 RepID=UPI0015CEFC69|nr:MULTISPECIES: hypothetical protein [Rhizobium]MBY4590185.1 hypothetical protein [Rhizobium redzepovicii]MBY4612913.1 hypothetical protein [Rhizobium redzepovicii]MDF0662237.1 hypothetical protein [Rhizobium sp. BC49]MDR9780521.1 hypothetical protein [Rhizobium redzepovicii]ULJ82208.1 hypothetical protein MF410_29300 [Rhizobium sp. C104]
MRGPTPLSSLVLPSRPLSLARNVISTPNAYFWSTPIILALAVFLFVSEAPGVIRDFQISQNPLVLENGDVQNGKCTTRKAVFTDCEAHLVYSYGGRNYDTEVEVMFVDFHTGDYETDLVISVDHPELATMSLGLDMLWNRIITLTLFVVLLGGMSLGMIFLGIRIWRVKGQLRRPARLIPVPVEISAFDRKRGVLSITYNDKIAADKTGRSAYTRMKSGQEPLIVGEANGKAIGMAVRHGNTALPVLLDNRLQRVELTDAERAAALAPLGHQQDGDQAAPVLIEEPKKTVSILRRLQLFFGTLLLIVVGVVGFWLWYVTSSPTQFQSPGMDINNLMPAPLNEWGCEQLKKRFGQDRAPFGCTAADYTSWK